MKKVLSLLLALSMVFMFASCGGAKQESKDTVTVVFDTDGGSAVEPQTIKKGSAVVKPATPKKEGYIFDKWMLGSAEYEFGTPVNENIVLKANWIDPNNGGNSGGSQSDVLFTAKTLVELHVRKGPGTDYEVDRNLPQGSTVDVYETKEAGGYTWNRIGENEWIADDGTWLEKTSEGGSSGGNSNSSSDAHPTELYWVNNWYWVQEKCEGDPEWVVKPESLKDQVTFTSSDTRIATVNSQGIVYGVKPGNVTITIKCGDMTDTLPLEVRSATQPGISLSDEKRVFQYHNNESSSAFFTLTVSFNNGSDPTSPVTWTSSNPDVAYPSTVSSGLIEVDELGYALITATTAEGYTASCDVYVVGTALRAYYRNTNQPLRSGDHFNKGYSYEIVLVEDSYYESGVTFHVNVSDQVSIDSPSQITYSKQGEYGILYFDSSIAPGPHYKFQFSDPLNVVVSDIYYINID